MCIEPLRSGNSESPKRKPPIERSAPGALRVDVDIRLTGKGLVVTPAQIAKIVTAAIASLSALAWILLR